MRNADEALTITINVPHSSQEHPTPQTHREPTVILLRPPFSGVHARHALATVGGIEGLARAVAHAANWAERGSAVVVARPWPQPLLGVMGRFDAAARARFDNLQWQLEHVLPRLLLLGYPDVESAAVRLADALSARFGRPCLRGFSFAAIPRGGHVVLGLLGYALGLDHRQMEARPDDERPLVVVDDCALSGARFREYLSAVPRRRHVVFAPLASTPELRSAVERDPRVTGCISAIDLRDAAPVQVGDDHGRWQDRWQERRPGVAYWIGRPQHVCFPWNEPDLGVWNPVTEREERGWPLLPPDRCLKHRSPRGGHAAQVQVQPVAHGPIRPADDVLFGTFENRVLVVKPSWPSNLALEGVAAAMWGALVLHGTPRAALAAMTREYGGEPKRIETDMETLVADLRRHGALAP